MILDQIALHSVQYRFQLNFMNILRQLLEEKAPVNNVKEEFPMLRNTTASKIGNGIISLLWQLWWHGNPDQNNFSSLANTAMVVIFPNLC